MTKRNAQWGPGSDEEPLSMGGNVTSEGTGRWLGGVLIVAVTFAAAYYLPLHRTHSKLVEEYGALSERVGTAERDLAAARAELATAQATVERLSSEKKSTEGDGKKRAALLASVADSLKTKLASESGLSVQKKDDSVIVHVDAGEFKTVRDHAELSSGTSGALCSVAGSVISGLAVKVVALGGRKGEKNVWDSASNRAATVAHVLESKCGLAAGRIALSAEPAGDGAVEIRVENAAK